MTHDAAMLYAIERERLRARPRQRGGSAAERVPWLDLPVAGQTFTQMNAAAVVLPAIGAEATVVSFVVPPGRNGVIQAIANQYVGGGWTEGSGDIVWRIAIDTAAVQGFNNILASVGSLSNPGDFANHPLRIRESQTVALICRNVAVVVAGQNLLGMLRGYYYPLSQERESPWL